MIKALGDVRIIGLEVEPAKCSYCGKIDELRPYGKNAAMICFDCGMKPENKEHTNAMVKEALK